MPGRCCRRRAARCTACQPARRAHLGGRLERDHALAADHQHPRRAPRGRRAVPPAPRDRRRLEHERVHDVPQGGDDVDHPAHARGGQHPLARPLAREPDPGDPRDQPRHDLPAAGAPRERARAVRGRDPVRVPDAGAEVREEAWPLAARAEGARHVGARDDPPRERPAQAADRGRLGDQVPPDRGVPRTPRPPADAPTRRARSTSPTTT